MRVRYYAGNTTVLRAERGVALAAKASPESKMARHWQYMGDEYGESIIIAEGMW